MVVPDYMLHISHRKVTMNISLYEAWFLRKPNFSHLKVFGYMTYVLIDEND